MQGCTFHEARKLIRGENKKGDTNLRWRQRYTTAGQHGRDIRRPTINEGHDLSEGTTHTMSKWRLKRVNEGLSSECLWEMTVQTTMVFGFKPSLYKTSNLQICHCVAILILQRQLFKNVVDIFPLIIKMLPYYILRQFLRTVLEYA